jgi:hypothetical protein
MRYLQADRENQKVWYEMQALAWNRPELRERVARVNNEWRAVLREAFAEPHERYEIDVPRDALVSPVGAGHGLVPEAKQRVPELRMIVVAGPRIDPASLPAYDGLESARTSRTSTGTWRPATSPSCRAG